MNPLLSPEATNTLRNSLLEADYRVDAVLDRIGETGQAGLQRNQTIPAMLALKDQRDPLSTMITLWLLQRAVPVEDAAAAFDLDALVTAGLMQVSGDEVHAEIDVRPFSSEDDGATGWIVSDLMPGLDGKVTPTRPDYVLGVSSASTSLAQMTIRRPIESALDLGTGCGVQSLHLVTHAKSVTATDLNPRALQLAALTASLNEVEFDLREGSLFEPVAGQTFDLIVTNPPYVMSPPTADGDRLVYREGSHSGDGLVEAIIRQAPDHLTDDGTLQVLGNWAIVGDQTTEERIGSWVEGSGCDVWVLERERLDPFEYIEVWLTDAGLAGSPQWEQRYREWVDYFAALNITGVGMGWITLTKAGRDTPLSRYESWPWAIEQPVSAAIERHQNDWTNAARPEAELLARAWSLGDDITEEQLGRPGESGPQHIVLRSNTALRRAVEADTLLAAVLGACDGELTLGQIISAVATLLEVDEEPAHADVLPKIREVIRDGFLS